MFVRQLGGFCVIINIKMSVWLANNTFDYLWTHVVMLGDLVRVELFMWPTTSFDSLFANFKLGKRLWEVKKDNIRTSIWISGISLTLPVAAVFSRHSDRSRENETKIALCKQNWLPYCTFCLRCVPDQGERRRGKAHGQTWVCNIIQSAGWLRRPSQGARKGQSGALYKVLTHMCVSLCYSIVSFMGRDSQPDFMDGWDAG